jgi:alkylhydroperoxidase family enzyme
VRIPSPRIAPLADAEMTDEQRELLAPLEARGRPVLNIFRTMATHPDALRGFFGLANHVMSKRNTLPGREREIVILRAGFLSRAGYEWTQHVPIGRRAGLTDAEIEAIKAGADAPGWSEADRALLRATDELHRDQFVGEVTWQALAAHFSQRQCVDAVLTAGQYTLVSMLLNSLGVQLDEGQVLDPDLDGRPKS